MQLTGCNLKSAMRQQPLTGSASWFFTKTGAQFDWDIVYEDVIAIFVILIFAVMLPERIERPTARVQPNRSASQPHDRRGGACAPLHLMQ